MADTKLTELTENTSPALEDLIYTVDDPGGTPVEKSMTIENVNRGLVLLKSVTEGSGVASIDVEDWYSADYDEYQIEFVGIGVATDGVSVQLRVSTDGGSSYDSGSNYNGAAIRFYPSGTASDDQQGSTELDLTGGTTIGDESYNSGNGSFRLFNPGSTSLYKRIIGDFTFLNTAINSIRVMLTGLYSSTTAVNAFQIFASSGNITGTVRVYGIRK
jgi:hypothetical protein